MFGRVSTVRFSRLFGRHSSEGGGLVACAATMPLAVLALAVTADYARVSHFRDRVQQANKPPTPPRSPPPRWLRDSRTSPPTTMSLRDRSRMSSSRVTLPAEPGRPRSL